MGLNRNNPEPLFEQIQTWIRERIIDGIWPENYKLTAESELSEELGVNRGTLRKAIGGLVEEGLLIRTHGKGTFVAPKRLEQPLAENFITFSEGLISRGIPFETAVISQTLKAPNATTAALLNLSKGAWTFFLERVRFVNDKPIIVLRNHVVYDRCPGIEQLDFTRERLFDVLERQYGLSIDGGQRMFEARSATSEIATHLGLSEGEPVMYIQQVSHLKDGMPVELSDLWIRGDYFRLSSRMKRDRTATDLRELLVGVE